MRKWWIPKGANKKADLTENCDSRGAADCARSACPEYDVCDHCGRRTCKYASVTVNPCTDQADEGALICRTCADEYQCMGYFHGSIKEGAIFVHEGDYKRWLKEVA